MLRFVNEVKAMLESTSGLELPIEGPQASVSLVFFGNEPQLILTKRALHLRSHAGEIAFAGGMWEPEDSDLEQTCIRETQEELGVDLTKAERLGFLSSMQAKSQIPVSAFVYWFAEKPEITPAASEVAEVFFVPWTFFLENEASQRIVSRHGQKIHIPSYQFNDYNIWGLTAMFIEQFKRRSMSAMS